MIWPDWCQVSRPMTRRAKLLLPMSLSTVRCLQAKARLWSTPKHRFICLTSRVMLSFPRSRMWMFAWYRLAHINVSFCSGKGRFGRCRISNIVSRRRLVVCIAGQKTPHCSVGWTIHEPVFNREHSAFIWNYYEGSHIYSWLLQFPDKESLEHFKDMFGRCIFEALNQTPFSKFEASYERWSTDITYSMWTNSNLFFLLFISSHGLFVARKEISFMLSMLLKRKAKWQKMISQMKVNNNWFIILYVEHAQRSNK